MKLGLHFNAVAFTVALGTLAGCSSGADFLAAPGKTTGVVTINSAQVYSRERLLNDRNREEAWLRKVLDASETCQFGFQGGSDIRSLEVLAGETSAVSDVKKGTVPRPGSSEGSNGETQFKSKAGTDLTSTLGQNKPQLTTEGPAPTSAVASPIDNFRDCVAYREEIRAQLIETQLDDGHDLDGKTLYRLQFSPTVLPGHDTDSWAILKVRVNPPADTNVKTGLNEDLYKRWVQHQRESLNDRLIGLVSAVRKGEVSTKNDLAYIIWFLARANNECGGGSSDPDLPFGFFGVTPEQFRAYEEDRYSFLHSYRSSLKFIPDQAPSTQVLVSDLMDSILRSWAQCRKNRIAKDQSIPPHTDDIDLITKWLLFKHSANYVLHQAEQQFGDYLRLAVECAGGACRLLVNEALSPVDGPQAEYEECSNDPDNTKLFPGSCPNVVSYAEKPILKRNFAETILAAKNAGETSERDSDAIVYAVTPKETVQRISDVGGRREIAQTMLRLSALLGAVSVDSALTHLRDSQLLLHAIRRQPLVVGFTDRHQVYENLKGVMNRRTNAEMGWLLGPSFKLIKDGTGTFGGTEVQYGFRHVNKQNSLAAAIAVPSWWPYVDLLIAGCWRASVAEGQDDCNDVTSIIENAKARDDEKLADKATFKPETRNIRVKLPVDISALDRVLAKVDISGPEIQIPDVVDDLVVGNSGRILITGNNLWRNTVVTVGSQKADRITILPNMRGLIAEFNEVYPPAGWGVNEKTVSQPIYVWTSDGRAYAGNAELHGGTVTSGRVGIKSTPVIKSQPIVLDVSRNVVPATFSSVEIGYRRYDAAGIGNWTKLSSPAVIDTQAGTVTVTNVNADCDACASGTIVEAAVIVTPRPGAAPDYHKATNTTVFYSASGDANVKLLAAGTDTVATNIDLKQADITGANSGKLRFVYPLNDEAAFGVFKRASSNFEAYQNSATSASQLVSLGAPTCNPANAAGPLQGRFVCEIVVKGDQVKLTAHFSGNTTQEVLSFKLKGSGPVPAVVGTLTVKKQ